MNRKSIYLLFSRIIQILILVNLFLFTQVAFYFIKINREKKELRRISPFFRNLSQKEYEDCLLRFGIKDFSLVKDKKNPARFYIYKQERLIGYLYDIKKDIDCTICSDLRFILYTNTFNQVLNIQFITPMEFYGKQIDTNEISNFIGQFKDENIKGINIHEIDVISGATKSSIEFVKALQQTLK